MLKIRPLIKYLLPVAIAAAVAAGWQASQTTGEGQEPSGAEVINAVSGFAIVRMTEDGFIPSRLTVKLGTKVTFVNDDTFGRWPASDFHPSHTLYPAFDPKRLIKPGEEWTFEFDRIGEWGMHDHLSPYLTGKIIVIE